MAVALDQFKVQLDTLESVMVKRRSAFGESRLAEISDLLADARETPLRVVVIGPFGSGKSSLLNALLGKPVLPVSMKEETATTFRVRSVASDVEEGLLLPDGRSLPLDQIGGVNATEHQVVNVNVHSSSLTVGIEFLDTPGLSSALELHQKITSEALAQADVVLLVVATDQGVTETLLTFLRAAKHYASRLYVILSKGDLRSKEEREEILSHQVEVCQPLSPAGILLVSAMESPGPDSLLHLLREELPPRAAALKAQSAGRRTTALADHLTRILQELREASNLDTTQIDARIAEHAKKREALLREIEHKADELHGNVRKEGRQAVINFERRATASASAHAGKVNKPQDVIGFCDDLRRLWELEASSLSSRIEKMIGDFHADLNLAASNVIVELPGWTQWVDVAIAVAAIVFLPLTGWLGSLVEGIAGKMFGTVVKDKLIQEAARRAMLSAVSQWVTEAGRVIESRVGEMRDGIRRSIEENVAPQMRDVEEALEELKQQKVSKVQEMKDYRKELDDDIQRLASLRKGPVT